MTDLEYEHLSSPEAGEEHWFCPGCMPAADPVDSLSEDSDEENADPDGGRTCDNDQGPPKEPPILVTGEAKRDRENLFSELGSLKHKKGQCPIFGFLNINSCKYKYTDISLIFNTKSVDIFAIGEIKLDQSFPTAQFHHPGYAIYRKDRTQNGGGIIVYVRSELPVRRREKMESTGGVETIVLENNIGKGKWACAAMYRPPRLADQVFSDTVSSLLEEMTSEYKNIIIFSRSKL